jgi:hypothetical protein
MPLPGRRVRFAGTGHDLGFEATPGGTQTHVTTATGKLILP